MRRPTDRKPDTGRVTRLLSGLRAGEVAARGELFEMVYAELKRIASLQLALQPKGATLQPTILVHEASIRLLGREAKARDRQQFLGLAACAMRDVVVEQMRARASLKRGGSFERCELDGDWAGPTDPGHDLMDIQESIDSLREIDLDAARVLELRVYGGLMVSEIADELQLSASTVDRRLAFGKAWLARRLALREDD